MNTDVLVLKVQSIGLVMLGIFKITGAEFAAWVSVPAAILSGTYWALKLYAEFIKKRKK